MSRDLLFEIGVEELPTDYVLKWGLHQLEVNVIDALNNARLGHGACHTYATPRRLTVLVEGVADRQDDSSEEVTGPSIKSAFDADGQPTKALLGFCKGKDVELSAVRRVETDKGGYVVVRVDQVGKTAQEVLPELLSVAARFISFPKSMRWDDGDYRFGRPVRWLLALFGSEVLPVQAFGLTAGRLTYGHRFLHPGSLEIDRPTSYLRALQNAFVIADHRIRRELLLKQVQEVALEHKGSVHTDDELIDINNFLVEWPTAFVGQFDRRFHGLPNEVLIMAMREHQRFFAVDHPFAPGMLLQLFIAVRNGTDQGIETIRKGNQDVLTARLEDAGFYYDADIKQSPESLVERLNSVVWMAGLGTLREKAARLEGLSGWLAAKIDPSASEAACRAALLCKTDLLGEMIGSGKEYASLEGIMGGYYATSHGETEQVSKAIYEHYRPRGTNDRLPESSAGRILSLADKLDQVAGAFVAGKAPTGSEDPLGVRRAAYGLLRILVRGRVSLDLRAATIEATRPFFTSDPDLPHAEIIKKLADFWKDRIWSIVGGGIEDDAPGHHADRVDAAMCASLGSWKGWFDPHDCHLRVIALENFEADSRFVSLVVLYKRVANILKAATEPLPPALDAARLKEPAEQALLAALEQARAATAPLWERRAYAEILPALLALESPIHTFFDNVMVNVDDTAVRANRLRLLADVRDLFVRGWDLSKIVVAGEKG